jgi:hypothetical protein
MLGRCPTVTAAAVRCNHGVASEADARLALDDFRAVGTRNESLASRDSINFLLPGLRCNEDEHAEGPEKRAERG